MIHGAIALVFPSLWECFGFPVLEAMACTTPVITSNLSSLPGVARNTAIVMNPHNITEITEAKSEVGNFILEQLPLILQSSHQKSWLTFEWR
ncbi:glycosyltransferase [Nostoc spongiaeforme FACHB-130]|uniref:Glycosyltransferase n=1 Tax=Nostoc spongiaeforme FACHB-130 TaxID=1357510 RepID=A0ABR8G514_9NOSO|nr:glycosyltransferase [Nostoc spongiaeforme FACHB-130]